jgi:cardiolipin synthase
MVLKEKSKNAIITIPNLISLSRLILSPVFLYFVLSGKTQSAFITFLIAISTDFFDGAVARMFKQKSNLGALLDPLGDKVLMTTSFIALSFPSISHPNTIPIWLTIAVIGRDVYIVTGAAAAFKLIGQKKFPPTITGKASTVLQMATPLSVLLLNTVNRESHLLLFLFILTLIMTVLSGIHYTFIGLKWLNQAERLNRKQTH